MTSTSPSRRVERKERLRGEILAAAGKMFADRGYEAVTLRAIAKEIGYTHAVIYQHFPDKCAYSCRVEPRDDRADDSELRRDCR